MLPARPFIVAVVALLGQALYGPTAAGDAPDDAPAAAPPVIGSWTIHTSGDDLPHDDVLAVHVTSDRVWVGTAGGLARFEDGAWTRWTTSEGLPWPAISGIDVDPLTGDLWLGTWGGGLVRFSAGRFDQVNQLNSGLAGDLVFAVKAAGGRIWAATNGGLSALDVRSGTWRLHHERRADAPEIAVTGLAADTAALYAAAWCAGLHRFDLQTGRWTAVRSQRAAPAMSIDPDDRTCGIAVAGGGLWWVTQPDVRRRDRDGDWSEPIARFGSEPRPVTAVAARDETILYIGTGRGLEMLLDGPSATWVEHRRAADGRSGRLTLHRAGDAVDVRLSPSALPDDRVRCLAFRDDELWVGTAGGLARAAATVRWETLPAPAASDLQHAAPGPARPRDEAGTSAITTVGIGLLRPGNRTISIPGADVPGVPLLGHVDRMAAVLAVEQANARGGYRGRIPFDLTTGPTGSFRGWGWTTPEDDFVALADRRDVAGLVGYLGSGSRFTTAAAARAELPLVNCADTVPTADEVLNPWIFRCRGEDPRRCRLVLDHVLDHQGCARLAVLRSPRDGAAPPLDWWLSHAEARGHPIVLDLTCDVLAADPAMVLTALRQSGADAVLTWGDAVWSASLIRAMRGAGLEQLVVGGPGMLDDEFQAPAGAELGSVIAVWPAGSAVRREAAARFADAYEARFRRRPDAGAHLLYESVNHLIEAIQLAGLDRDDVAEALGGMDLDADGEAHAERWPPDPDEIVMGRLRGGRWEFLAVSDLPAPPPPK